MFLSSALGGVYKSALYAKCLFGSTKAYIPSGLYCIIQSRNSWPVRDVFGIHLLRLLPRFTFAITNGLGGFHVWWFCYSSYFQRERANF